MGSRGAEHLPPFRKKGGVEPTHLSECRTLRPHEGAPSAEGKVIFFRAKGEGGEVPQKGGYPYVAVSGWTPLNSP